MGDYLFAKAFRIMVEANSLDLMRAISRATERVAVGELRQIEETGNYDLSEQEYLSIIADKTASLFAVSCEAGPILKKRVTKERAQFADFGEKVGTAFQMADDLLDFVGDPELTGKEPGNDVLTGKVTLPLIYSLRSVNNASRREVVRCLRNGDDETFDKIHDFVTETGGIEYTYLKASELSQRGLDAISSVSNSVYFERLQDMVNFTTARRS
jgi:octaprenyl-diphosphate synthase